MMQLKNLFRLLLIFALVLNVSCSDDDSPENNGNGNVDPESPELSEDKEIHDFIWQGLKYLLLMARQRWKLI